MMQSLYLQYKIHANSSGITNGPVFWFWAYLMKVISEIQPAN